MDMTTSNTVSIKKSTGLGNTIIIHPSAKQGKQAKLAKNLPVKPDRFTQSRQDQLETTNTTKPDLLNLLKHLPEGNFKQYVVDVAMMCNIHSSTSLLVALGVVSAIAGRVFAVQYPNGERLPVTEYIICGAVPGSGKSRMLKNYQRPIFDGYKEAVKAFKEREKQAEEAGEPFEEKAPISFLSDSTMEGLEPMLSNTDGYFALASAEQGVINTLIGASYGGDGRKNNNDLALKGFNGEYHASSRTTRSGYTGEVVGSITCFAQEGAIETILQKSDGTGMAERFLMLAEPTLLGTRDHTKRHYPQEYSQNCYNRIVKDLAKTAFIKPIPFDELPAYRLSDQDWHAIALFRNEIEPYLADGGKYSSATMRGIASKVDMHIMKISALLACLYDKPIGLIPSEYVNSAISIMRDMLDYSLNLLFEIGVVGFDAEEDCIINYLGEKKSATSRQIQQAKAKVKPFKESHKPYDTIRQTIDRLIKNGVVAETESFDSRGNSLGKLLKLIA